MKKKLLILTLIISFNKLIMKIMKFSQKILWETKIKITLKKIYH